MTRFKLIINCGPCEFFIESCLRSVRAQTHTEWRAHVTIDPCGDRTLDRALMARAGDARIMIEQNAVRRYSMHNLVEGIRRSAAEPEDVIVILDGDDWFATEDALRIIAGAYATHDCWMTYGSWLTNMVGPNGRRGGLWPAYPPETTDFRHTPWLGTAVRTWKKWLWDHVDDRDLRDDSGEYLRASEDQATMLPLLEMCGVAKARHIADALMVYNKATPYATSRTMAAEIARNGRWLQFRPPYARLREKTYKRASQAAGALAASEAGPC